MDGVDAYSRVLSGEEGRTTSGGTNRTFYEFFCGGGLVRLGLGDGWDCVGAVDNDPGKIKAYRENFGPVGLLHADVRDLDGSGIPGVLDLAWASFPCQNVSVAGTRSGLDGAASGAFWPFWKVIRQLVEDGRAPSVIALENVRHLIVSNGGSDFPAVVGALVAAGYKVGALVVDAALFLPHSRKRIFIVAIGQEVDIAPELLVAEPVSAFHPPDLRRAVEALPPAVRKRWPWWNLPEPTPSGTKLHDVVEPGVPEGGWHTEAETTGLIAQMDPRDLARLDGARTSGKPEVGTIYMRSRDRVNGRTRRANVRMDGIASCLVMPNGRMSSQILLFVEGDLVRTRYITPIEGARLMGLPGSYVLPRTYNATFGIFGDGVAVPVVRHLAGQLLEPLADAARSWRPRTVSAVRRMAADPARGVIVMDGGSPQRKVKDRPGIKGTTVGTTLYLLPGESKRLRRLALDLDVSLHELLMRGADRLLAENGQRPIERYRAIGKARGA